MQSLCSSRCPGHGQNAKSAGGVIGWHLSASGVVFPARNVEPSGTPRVGTLFIFTNDSFTPWPVVLFSLNPSPSLSTDTVRTERFLLLLLQTYSEETVPCTKACTADGRTVTTVDSLASATRRLLPPLTLDTMRPALAPEHLDADSGRPRPSSHGLGGSSNVHHNSCGRCESLSEEMGTQTKGAQHRKRGSEICTGSAIF